MSAETTGAIILAAGNSSRLGQPKQFLQYQGETLIHRTARAALEVGCSPVVVVAGAAHERIAQELAALEVRVCPHPEWERGMGSSIRVGVEQALLIAPSIDAILLLVCDQLHVTSEVLTTLLEARASTLSPAIASTYADTVGVPAIFDRTLFPQLAALSDRSGAKQLLHELDGQITRVPFREGGVDIDTPDDCRQHLG